MMMQTKYLMAMACVLAVACGNDDNNGNNASNNGDTNNGSTATNNQTTDTNQGTADMGGGEDIPTFGDVGGGGGDDAGDSCDEAAALADAWPLNDAVSTGTVDATDNGGTWTASLDAAAGGTANAASNPFLYLDLDGGAKVDVTDSAAPADGTWEIAFRRTAAFINGGDSGSGGLEIARLTGVTFDGVTSGDIPADASFVTEDGVDENCEVIAPPSGFGTVLSVFEQLNPDTTSGSWFNYSMSGTGPAVTAYDDHVYIIRTTDQGKTYKFSFVSWDSGVIDVQWAEL